MSITCYNDWCFNVNYDGLFFKDRNEETKEVLNLLSKQIGILLLIKVGDVRYYFVQPAVLFHFVGRFYENHLFVFYFAAQHVMVDSVPKWSRLLVIGNGVFHTLKDVLALTILLGHTVAIIEAIRLTITYLKNLRHFLLFINEGTFLAQIILTEV